MQDALALAPQQEWDELALVGAARDDPAAFGVLYELHVDRIYAYLRTRTGTPEDAADLTQQVFLRALRALPRYRDRKLPFAAWLFRIARNSAINFHRDRRASVTWDLLPEALQPSSEGDLSARLVRGEDLNRLRVLLSILPADTRELLALRFAAGLTVPQIAAVIGAGEAATRMRLSRAVRSLKEQYDDEPD
jgi:RNA polymerase sigma-70 factor (ECF subfamily)